MKKSIWLIVAILASFIFSGVITNQTSTTDHISIVRDGSCASSSSAQAWVSPDQQREVHVTTLRRNLPLTFIENRGQADKPVRYYINSPRATIYFMPTEVVFHFVERKEELNHGEGSMVREPLAGDRPDEVAGDREPSPEKKPRRALALRVAFVGANRSPLIEGQEELPGKVSIFKGNDPSKWLKNISTYRARSSTAICGPASTSFTAANPWISNMTL